MTESGVVIPLTLADISLYDRYRAAELQLAVDKPTIAEMIEVTEYESDRIGASVRAAEIVYGADFNAREVRRAVVLQAVAAFLGIIDLHRDEIAPILRRAQPKWRRA